MFQPAEAARVDMDDAVLAELTAADRALCLAQEPPLPERATFDLGVCVSQWTLVLLGQMRCSGTCQAGLIATRGAPEWVAKCQLGTLTAQDLSQDATPCDVVAFDDQEP